MLTRTLSALVLLARRHAYPYRIDYKTMSILIALPGSDDFGRESRQWHEAKTVDQLRSLLGY